MMAMMMIEAQISTFTGDCLAALFLWLLAQFAVLLIDLEKSFLLK